MTEQHDQGCPYGFYLKILWQNQTSWIGIKAVIVTYSKNDILSHLTDVGYETMLQVIKNIYIR